MLRQPVYLDMVVILSGDLVPVCYPRTSAVSWSVPGLESKAWVMLATAMTILEWRCLVSSHVNGLGKRSTRQKPSKMECVSLMAGCCSS